MWWFSLRQRVWTEEQVEAADRADRAWRAWMASTGRVGHLTLEEQNIGSHEGVQLLAATRARIYGEGFPNVNLAWGRIKQEKEAVEAFRRNIGARIPNPHKPSANQL